MIKKYKYSKYTIEVIFSDTYLDFVFNIRDEEGKIVMCSKRPYDSFDDAYVRACTRINDELK